MNDGDHGGAYRNKLVAWSGIVEKSPGKLKR